ncbi:DUF4160 domain-containing protein [Cysteiniphilum sp. 19S12-1]|uniref:DUF4160 domain-containing protein n=1 Tax=Cysteiniphilum sp. 19S12-1 TaxID=3453130 RepID=UPI003F86DEC6
MPTILRIGSYSFYFYANEGNEPPHIHIRSAGSEAKFWLDPIVLASSKGFPLHELNRLEKYVEKNKSLFEEKWNEFFNQ